MAENDIVAKISGAALSFLFFENARSNGDQMGFLLGDMVTFVTKNVTDSERQIESVRRQILITNILVCSSIGEIFNEAGKLHREKLDAFLSHTSKEIVGWFRYRYNFDLAFTFRDKVVHKELAKYFSEWNNQLPQKYFIGCIMTASRVMGQHKFQHVLMRYENGVYRPLPLKINNLGPEGGQTDGSDYICKPSERTSNDPGVFAKLVKSLKLDTLKKSGSEIVSTIERAAEEHVKSLIPVLCESDREIYEMEREIRELRLKIINRVFMQQRSISNSTNESEGLVRTEGESNLKMDIPDDSYPKTKRSLRIPYEDCEQ